MTTANLNYGALSPTSSRHTHRALRKILLSTVLVFSALGSAAQTSITMASTTSTEQSGLFSQILPAFKKASGIDVKVVAVGTGQALDMARRGDADILFVHDQVAEEKFVAEGYGLKRYAVMYNDFVLIGPKNDPAHIQGKPILEALQKIASSTAPFISRGDKSGTHSAELRLWKAAGIANPENANYKACGCGMGPALNIAASSDAYILADRGTWLNFKNQANLSILVEKDSPLFNQYGVIVVNPAKHPHTQTKLAQTFADWITSPAGQAAIGDYKINAQALFFPNAKPANTP